MSESVGGRSLAEIAIEHCIAGVESGDRDGFVENCRRFLEKHHADAADYDELNLRLDAI